MPISPLFPPRRLILFTLAGLSWAGAASTVFGQALPPVNVYDDTGWNAWVASSSGNTIIDPNADKQTGHAADDFVGDASHPGFQQKAGSINNVDSILFRARMASFQAIDDTDGSGSSYTIGMDLNNNGSLDFLAVFELKSTTTRNIYWGEPGSSANTSPSTTSWSIQSTAALTLTPYGSPGSPNVNGTYSVKAVNDGFDVGGGGDTDSWVTWAIPFTVLTSGIQALADDNIDTGADFSTYTFDENSIVTYVGYTSTQENSINQDLFGTSGNNSSTLTWGSLGASTPPVAPTGAVPEPATYAQVGILLGGMLGWRWWRRRAEDAPARADGSAA